MEAILANTATPNTFTPIYSILMKSNSTQMIKRTRTLFFISRMVSRHGQRKYGVRPVFSLQAVPAFTSSNSSKYEMFPLFSSQLNLTRYPGVPYVPYFPYFGVGSTTRTTRTEYDSLPILDDFSRDIGEKFGMRGCEIPRVKEENSLMDDKLSEKESSWEPCSEDYKCLG